MSCVRAETPASVERSSQQVRAPRAGRCSDSSDSAASGRARRCARTAPLPEAGLSPGAPGRRPKRERRPSRAGRFVAEGTVASLWADPCRVVLSPASGSSDRWTARSTGQLVRRPERASRPAPLGVSSAAAPRLSSGRRTSCPVDLAVQRSDDPLAGESTTRHRYSPERLTTLPAATKAGVGRRSRLGRRPLAGRPCFSGKGAVLAHRLVHPLAAESDEWSSRPAREARTSWLPLPDNAGISPYAARARLRAGADASTRRGACGRRFPGPESGVYARGCCRSCGSSKAGVSRRPGGQPHLRRSGPCDASVVRSRPTRFWLGHAEPSSG